VGQVAAAVLAALAVPAAGVALDRTVSPTATAALGALVLLRAPAPLALVVLAVLLAQLPAR
jgi:hypothetical protein